MVLTRGADARAKEAASKGTAVPQPGQNNSQRQQQVPQQPTNNRGGKKRKPAEGDDNEASGPEYEDTANAEDDNAVKSSRAGTKRPAEAANTSSSAKVAKTGQAGPSKRDAVDSNAPAAADNDTGDQAGPKAKAKAKSKAKGRGKGRGKGKGKAKATDDKDAASGAPSWFVSGQAENSFVEGKNAQEILENARAATQKAWSAAHQPEHDSRVWKGTTHLGSGSYGYASAFYCENEDGLVFDRIAVKDTRLPRLEWQQWQKWWGHPLDTASREHMEVKVMKDIAPRAKEGRCVFYRGSSRHDEVFMYRIIMNYCPAGCLHDATPPNDEAMAKKSKNLQPPPKLYNDGRDLPEPLVWKWLEDLAKACSLMDDGVDHTSDDFNPHHHIIVHRDIKPKNIFLEMPSGVHGDWPAYPTAIMGDFGSACYIHNGDDNNPMAYNYWQGTPGYRPPELATLIREDTKEYVDGGKLGSATNVWSVGASLIALCNRDTHPGNKVNFVTPETSVPMFNANAQQVYSKELADVLGRCVRFRQDDRISTSELLRAVSIHTGGTNEEDRDVVDAQDRSAGMRQRQPTAEEHHLHFRLPKKEHYRIGLSFEEGEAQRVAEENKDLDDDAAAAKAERERKENEILAAGEAAGATKQEKAAAANVKRQRTVAANAAAAAADGTAKKKTKKK